MKKRNSIGIAALMVVLTLFAVEAVHADGPVGGQSVQEQIGGTSGGFTLFLPFVSSSVQYRPKLKIAVLLTQDTHRTITEQDIVARHYPPLEWWSQPQDTQYLTRSDYKAIRLGELDLTHFDLLVIPGDWFNVSHGEEDWQEGMPPNWEQRGIDFDDIQRDWAREIAYATKFGGLAVYIGSPDPNEPERNFWNQAELYPGVRDGCTGDCGGHDGSPRLSIQGKGKVYQRDNSPLYEDEFGWLLEPVGSAQSIMEMFSSN